MIPSLTYTAVAKPTGIVATDVPVVLATAVNEEPATVTCAIKLTAVNVALDPINPVLPPDELTIATVGAVT